MRILCGLLRTVMNRFFRQIVGAVLRADELPRFIECGIAHSRRVGAHVSDQADRSLAANLDAFVEMLCDHHRTLHRKAEFARSFLLQFRSNEGWNRIAFALLRRDFIDNKRLSLRLGNEILRLHVIADEDFRLLWILIEAAGFDRLFADSQQTCIERRRLFARQVRVDRPVLSLQKRFDLAFALDHHPQRYGLHAPGAQSSTDRATQQRRDFVTNQPIKHAPGLLCVD